MGSVGMTMLKGMIFVLVIILLAVFVHQYDPKKNIPDYYPIPYRTF